jgi:phage gp29-like protein
MGTITNFLKGPLMGRRLKVRNSKSEIRNLTLPAADPSIMDEEAGLLWAPVTPQRARLMLQAAAQGDLQQQEQLFRLMLDTWPRLAKATGEVCRAVSRMNFQVTAPEGAPEGWEDLVKRSLRAWRPRPATMELGFEEALDALAMARHTGFTALELHWQRTPHGILPRAAWSLTSRHYAWNDAGTEIGLVGQGLRPGGAYAPEGAGSGERGAWREFEANKFLVGAWRARPGAPVATALMRPLVPYWVGRTFGFQWLMQTAQIFGVPFRWANYDYSRPDTGAKVADMLRNLGSAGWAAFPAGTSLEFKEAVTNARDNPQMLLQELADQACDLLVLGQTLSSSSAESTGLGSGTADLHGQVRREVITGLAQWAADVLNYQMVPALVEINYGPGADPADLPVVSPDTSVPSDPRAEAERLEILVRAGVPIPLRWALETHGIPEADEGEAVIGREEGSLRPGGAYAPEGGKKEEGFGGPEGAGGGEDTRRGEIGGLRGAAGGPRASVQARAGELFEDLTGVSRKWLAPVEATLARLIALAEDGEVDEAAFQEALAEARGQLPELFDELDTAALAKALERAMGAAMVNGIMNYEL